MIVFPPRRSAIDRRRRKTVEDYAEQSVPLRVAVAYANVWKHHTRDAKHERYAWINTVTRTPTSMSAEIWYRDFSTTDDAEPHDAADLARQCVDAWKPLTQSVS
jgi:hypothetical protein